MPAVTNAENVINQLPFKLPGSYSETSEKMSFF